MKRTICCALLAITAMLWPAAAQDEAELQARIAAATPGPNHALLGELAGQWSYTVSLWMEPAALPVEASGRASKTMIMGGRYLQEELDGEFMGQPFQGRGVTGYDNVAGRFVSTWIDTAETGIMHASGRLEAGGRVLTVRSEYVNPTTLQTEKVRMVTRLVDRDHHEFEYWVTRPGAEEFLAMRADYQRLR